MRIRHAPIPFNLKEQGITQSLLGQWVKCRRLSQLTLQGWERPISKEAIAFGSLFHKLLEDSYNSIRAKQGIPGFETLAETWLRANSGRIGDMQMCELMLAKAAAIWDGYWDFWSGDVTERQWLAAESQFDVNWRGYRLRGMRDGIFMAKDTMCLLESKTKGRIDANGILLMLPMDWQNQFYLLASRTEGFPVQNVVYNIIRRPGQVKGKAESLTAYSDRIKEKVEKDPPYYFMRYHCFYTDETIKAFEDELLLKLREFERWLADPRVTWKTQSACQSPWNCEFLDACSSNTLAGYTQTRELFKELDSPTEGD